MPKVYRLLPHVASATNETRQAIAELVLENLLSYCEVDKVKVGVLGTVGTAINIATYSKI